MTLHLWYLDRSYIEPDVDLIAEYHPAAAETPEIASESAPCATYMHTDTS